MPLDPARLADTRAWLAKARLDLAAGVAVLGAAAPLTGDAMFHAQQAAEKSIKALLAWHDTPSPKTHDLAELGGLLVDRDPSLEPLLRRAAVLTEYAWRYRYPGESDEPSHDEARNALVLAREVYEAILSRLPDETRR